MPSKPPNVLKNQGNRTKKVLKNIRYIKSITKIGDILHELLKTDLSVSELKDAIGNLIDDATYSAHFDNAELPLEDYLQSLKITTQNIASNTRIFSKERQGIKNQLNIVYTEIQVDESLSDDEKQRFLRTIAEIRDIAQPPIAPRNPPSR